MTKWIETGRQHRWIGAAVHMGIFLAFYLLYLLIDATLGVQNPFYPFDWAGRRYFLFFWVPVLLVRLCNRNLAAGCMTVGFFVGLLLSIPLEKLVSFMSALEHSGDSGGYCTPSYFLLFWFWVVVLSIVLGVLLEKWYGKRKGGRDKTGQ